MNKKELHLSKDILKKLGEAGIDPTSLTSKQLDALEAMSGDLEKGHPLASWISFIGIALELGAVTNIIFNISALDISIIIVSIVGGLLGLFLIYIGFRIQHKDSLSKLIEEDEN